MTKGDKMKHSSAKRNRWTLVTSKMPSCCDYPVAYYFGKNWRLRPTLHKWSTKLEGKGQYARRVASFWAIPLDISIYHGECYTRNTGDRI
jgi:hypothetical protein